MISVLDLDSKSSWHQEFTDFLYSAEIWSKVLVKLEDGGEFLAQITYSENSVSDDLAKYLRTAARNILMNRHSHVTAYHGCRPRCLASYYKSGILPSDTSALIQEARSLFSGFPRLEIVVQGISPDYTQYNEGKIGLLVSEEFAKSERCEYKQGSELIRVIANRLGPEAEALYANTGKATVIKCNIPVDWLDAHTTFPMINGYANAVIGELIRERRWPNENAVTCDGGYYLTRTIPLENIVKFIEC